MSKGEVNLCAEAVKEQKHMLDQGYHFHSWFGLCCENPHTIYQKLEDDKTYSYQSISHTTGKITRHGWPETGDIKEQANDSN